MATVRQPWQERGIPQPLARWPRTSTSISAPPHRRPRNGRRTVTALIAPHAGLMFSGPVGAHAYATVAGRSVDVVVLVGPSHFVAFDGVALYPGRRVCDPTRRGPDRRGRGAQPRTLSRHPRDAVRARREHSLEMQLPFLKTVLPDTPIVPLLMGYQSRETIVALARRDRGRVRGSERAPGGQHGSVPLLRCAVGAGPRRPGAGFVAAFDAEDCSNTLEQYPEGERGRYVACGGGPMIAVMRAARALGARNARVLQLRALGGSVGRLRGGRRLSGRGSRHVPNATDDRADASSTAHAAGPGPYVDRLGDHRRPADHPRADLELPEASGVFVTIKRHRQLRGCLGTLQLRTDLARRWRAARWTRLARIRASRP